MRLKKPTTLLLLLLLLFFSLLVKFLLWSVVTKDKAQQCDALIIRALSYA